MPREHFTFYRSFWEAILALPKKDQLPFLLTVCAYALDDAEPNLSGATNAAFCIIKPILDKSKRRAESGQRGGSSRTKQAEAKQDSLTQAESKNKFASHNAQAKINLLTQDGKPYTETETNTETDTDTETETETGVCFADAEANGAESVVVVFDERLDKPLSRKDTEELGAFVAQMGPECCLRALDVAQDAGKLTWGYVRGILRNKLEQGVTSLEDWDRTEGRRSTARGAVGKREDYQPSLERIHKNQEWLDAFLEGQQDGT